MKWIKVSEMKAGKYPKPPEDRQLLCYCPEWSETGYQVAFWIGSSFVYEEQPNDEFDSLVEKYALFMEAD